MDTIRLPFNSTNSGFNDPKPAPANYGLAKPLLVFDDGSGRNGRTAFVVVEFDVSAGSGLVTLLLPTLAGELAERDFPQDGITRTAAIPLSDAGIKIYHISKRAKGTVLITII